MLCHGGRNESNASPLILKPETGKKKKHDAKEWLKTQNNSHLTTGNPMAQHNGTTCARARQDASMTLNHNKNNDDKTTSKNIHHSRSRTHHCADNDNIVPL